MTCIWKCKCGYFNTDCEDTIHCLMCGGSRTRQRLFDEDYGDYLYRIRKDMERDQEDNR